MGLVLATIVQSLCFGAFGALAATLDPVNAQLRGLLLGVFVLSKLAGLPFRHQLQSHQGLLEEGQQVMDPVVDPRLAQLKPLAQQGLERIGFLIDQDEQPFLLGPPQPLFPTTATVTWRNRPL